MQETTIRTFTIPFKVGKSCCGFFNLLVMVINVFNEDPRIVAHRIYLFCITRRLGRNLSDFLYDVGNTNELKKLITSKSVNDAQYLILKFNQTNLLASVVGILQRRGLRAKRAVNINNATSLLIYKEPSDGDADYIKDLEKRISKTREYLVK